MHVKFLDVCKDVTKTACKIPQREYLSNGKYKIFDQSQKYIGGYSALEEGVAVDYPYIVFGDHTRVVKFIEEPCFIGADGVKLLKVVNEEFLPKYIYYAMLAKPVEHQGYSRHFKLVKELYFEKVDKRKQQKIIDELEKIEWCIKLKNEQLADLDELVKSRFVELFGDLNDKKWNDEPLGALCEQLKRYPTFCNMEYLENGVRVIRIGNILFDGHMDENDDNYVFVYGEVNEDFPDTVIEMNDIVMAVRGDGSAAKRIGIVREDKLMGSNISPNLIRIKADSKKVLPVYLFYFLTSELGQKRLDAYVNKTAKKNIAAKDIAKVLVPVPDLRVQNEFISFVEQTDKLKVIIQKQIVDLQELLDSKMDEYFS